ncbi:hypothetical protein EV424DRAFT_1543983 [Suillus variegatus]|nr:hypothetical protein EV424DRAFT_1543983 [Suillus variegatus]
MHISCDALGMPIGTDTSAPRFSGDAYAVFAFLQSVDRLGQNSKLSDKQLIHYAIKYNQSDDKELWADSVRTSWMDFANEILSYYSEQNIDMYVRPEIPQPKDPKFKSPQSDIPAPDEPEIHEDTIAEEPLTSEVAFLAPEDLIAIPENPKISDLVSTPVQLPSEHSEFLVEVINKETLTSEVLGSELKPLGNDVSEILETSADDFSEISDIDIEVLDHELVSCPSDSTDNFVLTAFFVLVFTSHVYWYRYQYENPCPKIRISTSEIPEAPEAYLPVTPKIYPYHPQFSAIIFSFRHLSHRIRNI